MAPTNVDVAHKPRGNDESDEELRTLAYHRALAYDTLTGNPRKRADTHQKRNQKKRSNDPRPTRTYPPVSRPVSRIPTFKNASGRDRTEDKERRESSIVWHPRKPAYVLSSRKSEIDISNGTSLPRFEYRPHSTPQKQQQKPQTRYGPINDDTRSELGRDICPPKPQTTDPAIRSVQPLHITEQLVQYYNNTRYDDSSPEPLHDSRSTYAPESISRPSSVVSTVSRGRRMSRARPSSSTSTCSSCSPSITSTQRLSSSPSPSRGAWISDHPQQEQPSFRERASQQFSNGLHLNLQRTGFEPESSFIVHRVVKRSSEYVPASKGTRATPASPPATPTTPVPTIPWEPPKTAVPFAMQWRNINNTSAISGSAAKVDIKENKKIDTAKGDGVAYMPQDIEELEDKMRRLRQQQRSLADMRRVSAIETDAPSGSDRSTTRKRSAFLDDARGTTPTSESFFATEWSRRQAEDLVTPLRLLNPLDPDPSATEVSQSDGLHEAPEVSPDNRVELPSQSRKSSYASLVVAEALTMSPDQMALAESGSGSGSGERRLLKRKQGVVALR
ncbi:hypothetical protein F4814DRAFT_399676 [Daldinia grandis]|nr:hypothetical protein F4814DRAFT_399676 [Daldinia grandis]